jgi:phage-related protein
MPHSRSLGQGLFELRCKGKEGIGRAFYCTMVGREIVVLHSFIKKTQDTPDKELALARKRLKEVRNG